IYHFLRTEKAPSSSSLWQTGHSKRMLDVGFWMPEEPATRPWGTTTTEIRHPKSDIQLMIRTLALLLVSASIAPCENTLTRQERKAGFEPLYDGKTLTKWHSIKIHPDAGPWKGRKGIRAWKQG